MSSGMNVEQAKEYAGTMTYRQAISNVGSGKFIKYRKATMIKLRELAEMADRPQGWIYKAISIIDDMQREGIIDYEQAWEFRMRARMKGADDE